MRRARFGGLWVSGALALLSPLAFAQSGDKGEASARSQCITFALNVASIAQARDNGTSRAQIEEFNKTVDKKYVMPAQAIADVFDFPKLVPADLMLYWDWECQGRGLGLMIAPLATVADRLVQCPEKGNPRQQCLEAISRALKLPEDIYPGKRATAIMEAPPAPPPPPK